MVALLFILFAVDVRSPFHYGPSCARLGYLHAPCLVLVVSIVSKHRILSGWRRMEEL